MFIYRVGNFFFKKKVPLLLKIFNLLIRSLHNSATNIEKGIIFGYGGIGVVIHKRTVIGAGGGINSNVTMGGRSKIKEVPVIGNNVYISTGAKILDEIAIGHNSVIGANTVVINDVPENSVVAGVPEKVIKLNVNSKDFY